MKYIIILHATLLVCAHTSFTPQEVMVDVTNDFGVNILQLVSSRRENVAFSPYGVVSVGLVLYEGASGPTAAEIHNTLRLPWDRLITRIGFRDLHRYLKSYFTNDGFLRGLVLSKPNIILHWNYTRQLQFYGFDLKPADSSTKFPNTEQTTPMEETTKPSSTTEGTLTDVSTKQTTTTVTIQQGTEEAHPVTENSSKSPTTTQRTNAPTTDTETLQTGYMTKVPSTENTGTTKPDAQETEQTSKAPITKPTTTKTEATDENQQTEEIPTSAQTSPTTTDSITADGNNQQTEEVSRVTQTSSPTPNSTPTTDIANTESEETNTIPNVQTTISPQTEAKTTDTTSETSKSETTMTGTDETKGEMEGRVDSDESPETTKQKIATTEELTEKTEITSVSTMPASTVQTQMNNAPEATSTAKPDTTKTEVSNDDKDESEAPVTSTIPQTTVTSTNPQATVTSTIPQASVTSTNPQTTVTSTNPQATVTSTNPQATVTSTLPQASVTSTIPQTTVTSATPQATLTSTIPQTTVTSTIPQTTVTSTIPQTTVTSTIPQTTPTSISTDSEGEAKEATETKTALTVSTPSESTMTETQSPTEVITTIATENESTVSASTISSSTNTETETTNEINTQQTTSETNQTPNDEEISRKRRALQHSKGLAKEHREGISNWVPHYQDPRWNYHAPLENWFFSYFGGEKVPIITYSAYLPFAYLGDLATLALQLPLDDPRYYMLILLPQERNGLEKLLYSLQWCPIRGIVNQLKLTAVYATVPVFTVVKHVNLVPALAKLGILSVFDPSTADLSAMSPEKGIFVRTIEQVVTVSLRKYFANYRWFDANPSEVEQHFIANHPFAYFVLDKETHVTLMTGTIVNPTAYNQYLDD